MTGRRIVLLLAVLSVALVGAGFAVHHHGHFEWEGWPGAYGIFGLLSAVILVLVGRVAGGALRRDDTFYDGHEGGGPGAGHE